MNLLLSAADGFRVGPVPKEPAGAVGMCERWTICRFESGIRYAGFTCFPLCGKFPHACNTLQILQFASGSVEFLHNLELLSASTWTWKRSDRPSESERDRGGLWIPHGHPSLSAPLLFLQGRKRSVCGRDIRGNLKPLFPADPPSSLPALSFAPLFSPRRSLCFPAALRNGPTFSLCAPDPNCAPTPAPHLVLLVKVSLVFVQLLLCHVVRLLHSSAGPRVQGREKTQTTTGFGSDRWVLTSRTAGFAFNRTC